MKKAFLNHSICIYNKEPNSSTYIKGLAIERGESGFLGSNPNGKKIDDKLEGGENSFNHKYSVYNVILSEKII
ncbi:hypothetical protein QTH04_07250 [Clostridium perfringens]|nr:hypothetical protein [Clostridium perfringens]MDM0451080.1 hypothetical protein [Clostridium perfringens]